MKLLNDSYNKSCKPGYKTYKKVSDNIILIDNFFENFDAARKFFVSKDKWECIPYQNHAKPGYESLFPCWIGRSLLEKFVIDNQINDDLNSYSILCNFFYKNSENLWGTLANSEYFPHIDGVLMQTNNTNVLGYICLINLNQIPISTSFYSYKNHNFCSSEMENEWKNYNKKLKEKLIEYYNQENVSRNQVKDFLDQKSDLNVKLIDAINYKPNQAIIYPANLFHSSGSLEGFTFDNPRVLLRITFDMQVKSYKYE